MPLQLHASARFWGQNSQSPITIFVQHPKCASYSPWLIFLVLWFKMLWKPFGEFLYSANSKTKPKQNLQTLAPNSLIKVGQVRKCCVEINAGVCSPKSGGWILGIALVVLATSKTWQTKGHLMLQDILQKYLLLCWHRFDLMGIGAPNNCSTPCCLCEFRAGP